MEEEANLEYSCNTTYILYWLGKFVNILYVIILGFVVYIQLYHMTTDLMSLNV